MATRRRGLANTLTRLSVEASGVMAVRVGRLATAGAAPSARDRREFARMLVEKQAAAAESWFALWQGAALAWQQAWLDAALGRWAMPPSQAALERTLQAMLAPYGTRVSANARRLRGRR